MRVINCAKCGQPCEASSPRQKYCQPCGVEMNVERNRSAYHDNGILYYGRKVIVVHDPLPVEEGGYSSGAEFSMTDLDGHNLSRTFQPGTILKIGSRIRKYDGSGFVDCGG